MSKRTPWLMRLVRKCGQEKVLRALLMLESGASKKSVAEYLSVSAAYLSNMLKEVGPPVVTYRIPATLMGLEEDGFTDDLGSVTAQRPGWNAESYLNATGKAPLDPSKVLQEVDTMDMVEYQSFCLNTAERAHRYAAHIESKKSGVTQ